MRHRLTLTILTGLILGSVSSNVHAQNGAAGDTAAKVAAPLPDAKVVVDRMIGFLGGREAFKDLPPMTATGGFAIPAMNLNGKMTTWSAPPNLMKVEMDIPGLGKTLTGFNGTVGWSIDPNRGPSLMDGAMLDEIRRESTRTSEIDILTYYDSVKVTGRETFNDADCVVLELRKGDVLSTRLIEETTGRPVATRTKMPTPMGEIPATTIFDTWMTTGKIKTPSKTTIKVMNVEQVLTIDKVTPGKIAPDVFSLPPAIEALEKARKAKQESEAEAGSTGDETEAGQPSAPAASENRQ